MTEKQGGCKPGGVPNLVSSLGDSLALPASPQASLCRHWSGNSRHTERREHGPSVSRCLQRPASLGHPVSQSAQGVGVTAGAIQPRDSAP